MNDLISRQAAIDAVNNYLKLSEVSRTVQNTASIQEVLQSLPSADAIEIGVEYDGRCFSVTVEVEAEVYRNDSETLYIPKKVFKVERI